MILLGEFYDVKTITLVNISLSLELSLMFKNQDWERTFDIGHSWDLKA